MLLITQFEKPWNEGKAKIFQDEVLVTILFTDNVLLMLLITQFEKPWNEGKAKIFQDEVLVTILFMDNKTLYFLKINTAVTQEVIHT